MTAITEDQLILSKKAWLDKQPPKEEFIRQWNIIMAMPQTAQKLKDLDPEELFDLLAEEYYNRYLVVYLASLTIKGEAN